MLFASTLCFGAGCDAEEVDDSTEESDQDRGAVGDLKGCATFIPEVLSFYPDLIDLQHPYTLNTFAECYSRKDEDGIIYGVPASCKDAKGDDLDYRSIVPPLFFDCLLKGGGYACWKTQWPTCPDPRSLSEEVRECLSWAGGPTCFKR